MGQPSIDRDAHSCKCGAPRAPRAKQCASCETEELGDRPAEYWHPVRKFPPAGTPCVYAVTCFVVQGCPIKFGFSTRPAARLRDLQMGSPVPLQFMAVAEGSPELERLIHLYLFAHRQHGEWFQRNRKTLCVARFLLQNRGEELCAALVQTKRHISRLRKTCPVV